MNHDEEVDQKLILLHKIEGSTNEVYAAIFIPGDISSCIMYVDFNY